MAYLASTLITRSWYLSKIVARNLQNVSGDQMNDGLDLLNFLLEFKSSDLHLIPYWTRFSFNLVANQEMYFIPNLVDVETMTFNIGTIRYSMLDVSRRTYFGAGRVDNISSLPYNYHVERTQGGSNIFIYFLPSQNFPANITGKFALTNVSLTTDLTTVYDNFYIEYLRHALMEYMCNEYNTPVPSGAARTLQKITEKLGDVSPPDLSMQKMSSLNTQTGLNYADVNLGNGWRPAQ
jgi:hypothetical protein